MKRRIIVALVITVLTFSACGSDHNLSGSSSGDAEIEGTESSMQSDGTLSSEYSETQPDDIRQDATAVSENNAKIKAVVSKNCNYVYHILAVSNCGYDNEYGKRYKSLHPEADLQMLKKYEQYLTIAGGEHQGDLYFLCVILPSSLDDNIPVSEYFEALADVFATGEIERNFEAYQGIYEQAFSSVAEVSLDSFRAFYTANEALKKEIAEVAAVMYRNYDIYSDQVWETSLAELSVIADEMNKEFAKIDYVGKWENELGTQYKQDTFMAVMCNSMENGVQAIDISATKDVFYHSGEYASTVKFISHEFGIYLLKDILADTAAFQSYSTYELTESLAEYYNIVVCGGHDGNWNAEYIDYYKKLGECEPEITALEMFLRAVEHYNI